MSHHTQSESASETGVTTTDQARSDAQKRLERFGTEWFLYEHPELEELRAATAGVVQPKPGPDGLDEAAEEVLRGVQEELLTLESPLEHRLARELTRDRFWAITALIHLHGDKAAKELLLRITDGAPLAICMGDVCRIGAIRSKRGVRAKRGRTVMTMAGEVSYVVKGCRAVFVDTARTTGGDMWPGLCRECDKAKPQRKQDRAMVRRLNAVKQGHGATVYVGTSSGGFDQLVDGHLRPQP
jgi:hypothetical protein